MKLLKLWENSIMNNHKHKHYQIIRAYADGWKIEFFKDGERWEGIHNPSFALFSKYRIVPDEEGWLPWYGGECPVSKAQKVKVKFKDGSADERLSSFIDWLDHYFIAYKLADEPKPKVKMWQWVLSASGTAFTTANFYRDEAEVRETYSSYKIVQRADWTEIEVEES